MATNEWLGDAQAVPQAGTLTVGGVPATGDKVRVTVNRKYVEYTFQTADTTATMAANLAAALQASDIPEFKEVTWTYDGTSAVVGYSSATPGQPVTMAASATGGGATLTHAQTQAATGPNHADNVLNWSLGVAPADGQDVLIRGGSAILYAIDTAFAHDFASVEIAPGFTENIGLPFRNADYVEYRPRYAVFGNTVGSPVKVNCASGLLLLSLHGGDVVNVAGTGNRAQDAGGVPALNLVTRTGTSTILNVTGGDVGYCCETGQSGTLATVRTTADAKFTAGEGGTVAAYDQDGGLIDTYGVTTAATQTDGTFTQWDGTLGTFTSDGGKVVLRQTGTVASMTCRGQPNVRQIATCDCTADPRDLTFTNCSFTGGAVLDDPNERVTFSNPGTFDKASLAASDLGSRFLIQRT